jgi:hypothetical protein
MGLRLAITCRCGEVASVPVGTVWRCEKCLTSWDTRKIPQDEYQAFVRAVRKVQWQSIAGLAVIGLLTLALVVAVGPGLLPAGLVLLAIWYYFYLPIHRKRVKRLYATLPSWHISEQAR